MKEPQREGSSSDEGSETRPIPVQRPTATHLDAILGEVITVLDRGFVRVIDYMGSDSAIVQAARVSYGHGTKQVHEDRGLIRYLMRHEHTTPFEMCEIKLHLRVPMDTWRQWIRHRTANVNEYSTRYSVAIEDMQRTASDEWRSQSVGNRQGSGAKLTPAMGVTLSNREGELQRLSREVYNERLEAGVAREQARKDLPLSTYTEAYWKIDLHNLFHFLALRMTAHAQFEIRRYAETIGNCIVRRWCPLAWEAFVDYQLSAAKFSKLELVLLGALSRQDSAGAVEAATAAGWLRRDEKGALRPNREREEARDKLAALGQDVRWLS